MNDMDTKRLVELFVTQNDVKKFILGRTPHAKLVRSRLIERGIDIEAYIDEFHIVDEFDGKPVIHILSELPDGAIVLNGVVEATAYVAQRHLEEWGGGIF